MQEKFQENQPAAHGEGQRAGQVDAQDALQPEGRLLSALKWLVSGLLFLMMMITFIDVLGRYIFNKPIFGAAEMIQFLLAATVFAGLVLACHRNSHISVELFAPKIHARIPRLHDVIVSVFSIGGLLVITVELARIAQHALEIGRTTIVLEWPVALIAVPATLLCLLASIVNILWLYRRLR